MNLHSHSESVVDQVTPFPLCVSPLSFKVKGIRLKILLGFHYLSLDEISAEKGEPSHLLVENEVFYVKSKTSPMGQHLPAAPAG